MPALNPTNIILNGPIIEYGTEEDDKILFPYSTLNIAQIIDYAPDNTTVLGVTKTYSITGNVIVSDVIDSIWARTITDIRQVMEQFQRRCYNERQELHIYDGNPAVETTKEIEQVIPLNPNIQAGAGASSDLVYGPKIRDLTLTSITKFGFSYQWTVETFQKSCDPGCSDSGLIGPSQPLLHHTRAYKYAIDYKGYTIRTITGSAQVNPGANYNIDDYRHLLVPQEIAGFLRNMDFNISPNRLICDYTITDTEITRPLPPDLVGGRASWRLEYDATNQLPTGTLSGYYQAPKGDMKTQKTKILVHIENLALQYYLQFNREAGVIWISRTIEEDIYENIIKFTYVAQIPRLNQSTPARNEGERWDGTQVIGRKLSQHDGVARSVQPWGDANLLTPDYKVSDACDTINQSNKLAYKKGTIKPKKDTDPGSGEGVGGRNKGLTSTSKNPYIIWKETISYEVDNKAVVLRPFNRTKKAILQETGIPVVRVIQAGTFTRIINDPGALKEPSPIFDKTQAAMLNRSLSTPNITLGINGKVATMTYRYVMELYNYTGTSNGKTTVAGIDVSEEVTYSKDPRVTIPQTKLKLSLPLGGGN